MEDGKTDSPLNTHERTQTHTHTHTHGADSANKCPFILGRNCHDSISHTRPRLLLFCHKHFPMHSFNINGSVEGGGEQKDAALVPGRMESGLGTCSQSFCSDPSSLEHHDYTHDESDQ